MTKRFIPMIFAILGGCGLSNEVFTPPAAVPTAAVSAIQPSPWHQKVARLITVMSERWHYSGVKVDDELSERMLASYIEAMDPNKMWFLASDIAAFEVHRHGLDDALRRGEIEPVFEIFYVYRDRLRQRIASAISWLDTEPDFQVREHYDFDRSEMTWAQTRAELDEVWRKRVKSDRLTLALAGMDWEEASETLRQRYERVNRRTEQLNSDEVFESFMNACLATLDPYTSYFGPRNAEDMRIQTSLSYEGIGAALQLTEDYVTVLAVIPGGPAAINGALAPKDRITAVGQQSDEMVDVVGWRLSDVLDLIRGPAGTVVRLRILPGGAAPGSPEAVIELMRDKIKLEAQVAQKEVIKVAGDDERELTIGVIRVPSFYQDHQARLSGAQDYTSVTTDVRRLIEELETEGIDGLVMDLRYNGGGEITEATALAGLFIGDGPVMQVRDRSGSVRVRRSMPDTQLPPWLMVRPGEPTGLPDVREPEAAYSGPMAVLVNRRSASSSEIFAAAIQDYGRGVVIGQTTSGKGTVWEPLPLSRLGGRGQLNLTTQKYYRVTGRSAQLMGVEPDIELPSTIDPELIGESSKKMALPWDQIEPTEFSAVQSIPIDFGSLVSKHNRRVQEDPDFIHLLEEIAYIERQRLGISLSLNFDERKEEREEAGSRRLQRENTRRSAYGLEPLASFEDLDEVERVDVWLREAASIVGDMVVRP